MYKRKDDVHWRNKPTGNSRSPDENHKPSFIKPVYYAKSKTCSFTPNGDLQFDEIVKKTYSTLVKY